MPIERQAAAVLEYSDDLTIADAQALGGFVAARLAEVAERQREGTEAHIAAAALAELAAADALHLSDLVTTCGERPRGRTPESGRLPQGRSPGPAGVVEPSGAIAARFSEHSDFSPRWRELRYLCVDYEEFVRSTEDASHGPYGEDAHP